MIQMALSGNEVPKLILFWNRMADLTDGSPPGPGAFALVFLNVATEGLKLTCDEDGPGGD